MTVEPEMSVFRVHVKDEVGLQAHTRNQNRWFSQLQQFLANQLLTMTVSILEHLNKNLRDNLQPKSFCGSWYAFRCNNVSCSIFQERRRRSERQWKLLSDFAQREWTYEMKPNERVSEAGRESEDGREDAGPSRAPIESAN
jgi:hypothetical protein